MKKFYLLILALLVGCAKQPSAEPNSLIITAFSSGFESKVSENVFETGDKIGIFLEKNSGNNVRYETSDGSSWAGFGHVGAIAAGDKVTAYYPYSETATNMAAIEVSGGVDFMISTKTPLTITDNKASANLKFKHALSKLVATMAMPSEIAGVKTVSLESIIVKNVFRKGTINLADGKISSLTDKGDVVLNSGTAVIIPQTISRIEFVFKMEGGGLVTLAHTKDLVLESGKQTTLNAISNADLYFTSTLDLKSGEAQSNLPLSFFVAPGRKWTLASSETWLTFSATTGTGAATVKVNVEQNTGVPRTAILTLTDDKHATAVQKPMQNYVHTVTIAGIKWTTSNLTASSQGQTSSFTLCAKSEDYGFFWKWGSMYAYNRVGDNNPSGHWNGVNNYSTGAATNPTVQSSGYDYANISTLGGGVGGPIGDPCTTLGYYRTPTHTQWKALRDANGNNSVWVTLNGKIGRLFGIHGTAANAIISAVPANCIFLPAAGYRECYGGLLCGESSYSYYWSSSVYNDNSGWALYSDYNGNIFHEGGTVRSSGFSVRCVAK